MASASFNPESEDFTSQARPAFYIGQHDSKRFETLTDAQYGQVMEAGFEFTTAPVTNRHFYQRVVDLYMSHVQYLSELGISDKRMAKASIPGPVVSTLTDKDTSLTPGSYMTVVIAYASPWIDLCSPDPLISNISRQVLNLEVAYANFCGCRSLIVPGPRDDGRPKDIVQYARAIKETFLVAMRLNLILHVPMYREPGLEETEPMLSDLFDASNPYSLPPPAASEEIDLFGTWDTWHTIRSICEYSPRLSVALRVPHRLPEKELQTRWFSEPVHYLTFGPNSFQENKTGHPALSSHHQEMISIYMRLKNAPWMILYDLGPSIDDITRATELKSIDFPSLEDAHDPIMNQSQNGGARIPLNAHVSYLRHLQQQQQPFSQLESVTLTSFQDWLQSPLQPLSENLESSIYETFEGDPVKYDLYERAVFLAMMDWKKMDMPTSSVPFHDATKPDREELYVVVAGAGRGPLVARVLKAAERTQTPIQLWALEKNQNAYVYLLRRNEREWGGKVHVIKTDMRGWKGPVAAGHEASGKITTVDILVTELLGSFGDNELSPECLDGIQRHLSHPYNISIPASYTAHLSPISTPRIHAELAERAASGDSNAYETPWVTRLYQIDFVSQRVPGHERFQQAWEFRHPNDQHRLGRRYEDRDSKPLQTGGAGSMNLSGGANEHNARYCHLTFVCRDRGVTHGLAGYFESTLYTPLSATKERERVELSILPEQIDKKSKDMVSWFPIFFPLKEPLYFPPDSELEVSMWRQTDDTKVWYEWLVEAFMWVSPSQRVKVGASRLHSSRKVACLM